MLLANLPWGRRHRDPVIITKKGAGKFKIAKLATEDERAANAVIDLLWN